MERKQKTTLIERDKNLSFQMIEIANDIHQFNQLRLNL